MLGNVKRGRGCLCGWGPGGGAPCGGGRLPGPEGPVVKKGAPGPENPGLRGTLGGGGGGCGKGLEALGGRGKWEGWSRPPRLGGNGAVSVPSAVCTRLATGSGEVSAKLHWVLQMLSLLTASTPTSAISCRQLFTRRD